MVCAPAGLLSNTREDIAELNRCTTFPKLPRGSVLWVRLVLTDPGCSATERNFDFLENRLCSSNEWCISASFDKP